MQTTTTKTDDSSATIYRLNRIGCGQAIHVGLGGGGGTTLCRGNKGRSRTVGKGSIEKVTCQACRRLLARFVPGTFDINAR